MTYVVDSTVSFGAEVPEKKFCPWWLLLLLLPLLLKEDEEEKKKKKKLK